jgi:hypothetical protein
MLRRCFCVAIWSLAILGGRLIYAQPPQPADANATPPLGVDKFYFDLLKSENSTTRATAERYINLAKVQEWSDLSGKFKAVAHYVKHEPNLSTVTIAVMKGSGADRTADEKTVPVDKLSKTCQVRVKQIDLLQKKLKEMSAKAGPNGTPGAPMTDERGADPNGKGSDAGPSAPPGVAPADPSASEPDPLGFAEVQLTPVGLPPSATPGIGPGGPPPGTPDPGPGSTPPSAPPNSSQRPASSSTEPQPGGSQVVTSDAWQSDFEAFRANFKVCPAGKARPSSTLLHVKPAGPAGSNGGSDIDFGRLDNFYHQARLSAAAFGWLEPQLSPVEKHRILQEEHPKEFEDVTWQATFIRLLANGGHPDITLTVPKLPEPLTIRFSFDSKHEPTTGAEWSQFKKGDRVSFKGRAFMENPTSVNVYVREPNLVAGS